MEEAMKRKISILMMVSAALVVGMTSMQMTAAVQQPSERVTVDCDAGQSIQATVDKANPSVPLTLVVSGTCEENILIRRDDVTIDGNNHGAVAGTIGVSEGSRITIQNLCISAIECPNRVSSRH
jgi:hypothetical protein